MSKITQQDISDLFRLMEIAEIEPSKAAERAGISQRLYQYWRDGRRGASVASYARMRDAVIEMARERRAERRAWADGLAGKLAELGVEL